MSRICQTIIQYEHDVWAYLSDVFKYDLKGSEIGITNDLVYRIIKFYSIYPGNCEVYIFNENINEKVRGADIDLFIQKGNSNFYSYFMLQAKLLNNNGKYPEIDKWSPKAQYNTLIAAAKKEKAVPLYLLYNGYSNNSNLGNNDYGLSIVNANIIKANRFNHQSKTRSSKLSFNDVFSSMKSFHELFCIPISNSTEIQSYGDIYKSGPYENSDLINVKKERVKLEYLDVKIIRQYEDIIKSKFLAPYRIILHSDN